MADQRGHCIMAITSAFQADDAGSIPADRSNINVLMQADFFRRPTWTADSAVKTMLSLHSLSTFDIETNIGYHHKALVANSNA